MKNKFDGRYEELIKGIDEENIKKLKEDLIDKQGKLNRLVLSQILRTKFTIKTPRDTEEILYYNDGIFHSGGEIKLKEEAQKIHPKISKHDKEEVLELTRGKTYIDRDELNKDPNLITLKNVNYNIEENKSYKLSYKIYNTVRLPIKYDPDADCPNIKKFLGEVLDQSNIPVIQESIGYCLLKDYPIQKAIMFIGDGANGKSVLLNLIKTFLGSENVCGIPLQSLDRNRFASSRLYGKLANIYPDISSRALYETGVFKMMVGGDMITAEQKFRNGFNFVNHAKLMFSCNQLPETHDNTSAYFRRWIIIDFPNIFKGKDADKKLIKKLTTEEELSGLFNWAIKGLNRLLAAGDFTNSAAMEDIEKIYKMKSSPLSAFVDQEVEISMNEYILKDKFYEKFQEFCENNGLELIQKQEVGKKLPLLIAKVRTDRITIVKRREYIWKNIKLKSDTFVAKLPKVNTTLKNLGKTVYYTKVRKCIGSLGNTNFTRNELLKTLEDNNILGKRAEKTIELWLNKGIIFEFDKNKFKFV